MQQTTANDIIPFLKGVKRYGSSQWQALCPSHPDKNRSLSIAQAGDRLLLHCHAGCAFSDILKAIGVSHTHEKPDDFKLKTVPERKTAKLDHLGSMWALWSYSTTDDQINALGVDLGVSSDSLRAVGCCWAWPHKGWGFPMHKADSSFSGMRLRGADGTKWSVSGGKEGMFMTYIKPDADFCIVEGPTDLAALVTLGFNGLGRPNCSGAIKDIVAFCHDERIKPIIIADDDEPGIKGATELARLINGAKTWMLPAKDVREFVKEGGTRDEFLAGLRSL